MASPLVRSTSTNVVPRVDFSLSATSSSKKSEFYMLYLRNHYSEELLQRFYNELVIPLIPFEDEREPFPKLRASMTRENTKSHEEVLPYVNICMLFDIGDDATPEDLLTAPLVGAVQFDYYVTANSGCLTYLLVSTAYRGRGVARILCGHCQEKLELVAKSFGHLAGCNATFVETNSATKVEADNDVIPPALRHKIFQKMGMRLLDFDYVQAPLDASKSKVDYLLLLVFLTSRIPQTDDSEHSYYLPSSLVRNTVRAFWAASDMHRKNEKNSLFRDVDYKRMMDQLQRRDRIYLLDLPWDRPFTIVDLFESVDFELMVSYYEMMRKVYGRTNTATLEEWLNLVKTSKSMSTQIRTRAGSALGTQAELHVLLALHYSEHEREHAKPRVAGGLSFCYLEDVNCGFIQNVVLPSEGGVRMASSLFDWAISEVDLVAREGGHLAGANVIFMELIDAVTVRSSEAGKAPSTPLVSCSEMQKVMESLGWK